MGLGHWIGGALGFLTGSGPLSVLAGIVLGGLVQSFFNNDTTKRTHTEYSPEEQRNGFLFSLLVLSAYVVQADGRVMHSEMEVLRGFLRHNFGEQAVTEGEDIVRRLFAQRKEMESREGNAAYEQLIQNSCQEIASAMSYEQRLQLLDFLCQIAKADGQVHPDEVAAVKRVAAALRVAESEIDSLLNLGGNTLEAAYAVLEVAPAATDEEVRRAYKRLALQHHPDKVATLGEDVRRAAERKFQELGEAKERVYKARGMK